MDTLSYATHSFLSTRDIVKKWVKEFSKFRMTLNHVYKIKFVKKAYQFLIIFACQLYGQESMKTFPENWVVVLDHLVNERRPFN